MRTAAYTSAWLAAALVSAHGDSAGMPRLLGRQAQRLGLNPVHTRAVPQVHPRQARVATAGGPVVEKRAGIQSGFQCGPGFGSCAAGLCCSPEGWCGNEVTSCQAPDCLFQYGPACDANQTPAGKSTINISRTAVGSVPYGGAGIYDCVSNGVMALTFDDGPFIYTETILDILKSYNAKATFFITGNNIHKGAIDTHWASVIQRMAAEGHQIASHTWSHQNLTALTNAQRQDQMVKNEMAFRNILGYIPTYMRPPFSECDTACETQLKKLGYHITYFDLDTADYLNDSPLLIQNSKNNFDNAVNGQVVSQSDFLVISHDIHEQTAHNLTAYMLERMKTLGYQAVTVGDCLGDPQANWYRNAGGANPQPQTAYTAPSTSTTASPRTATSATAVQASPTGTLKVSPDASCGGNTGNTCQGSSFGNCCSVNGWCGSTADYCGSGCQKYFGSCTSSGSGSTPSSSAAAASTSTVTSSNKVSQDATCGGNTGNTCQGSAFGNCCSVNGWCGSTTNYCGSGCQRGFGTCN
ncbi:hypothetical protein MCOR25_007072 [Pyricularia grisea]|uniref:Chitin binding protein n=1 Tax=Pyricularia grisea TaxID=148305 RepID=A0A6P8AXM1_PYRGI|nr:hypothetical protein PgNI_10208 [Pyricularia grisea]KAI6359417.1 hypothetical protein MCOR25_007072 [Pyricularia grisea]TLD07039.1 hypothetical protein PgNI_10208 [Pyricularia grisea]